MNVEKLKKNVWATDFPQNSPFGVFKTIFKLEKNEQIHEIFKETKTIIQENEIIKRNSDINERIYDNDRFELIEKYKDFILEKEVYNKTKSLQIANSLLEKGMLLLNNLKTQKDLKNFDNRSNYILISYEIRKVFLDLLRTFNSIDFGDFLHVGRLVKEEENVQKCSEKCDGIIQEIDVFIKNMESLYKKK